MQEESAPNDLDMLMAESSQSDAAPELRDSPQLPPSQPNEEESSMASG